MTHVKKHPAGLSQADLKANRAVDTALATGPLSEGANAAPVKTVEKLLKLAGYEPGVRDNKFTAKTASALREFQGARGLPQTGVLDAQTWKDLQTVQKNIKTHQDGFEGVGQKDKNILGMEKNLKKLGYDAGAVDGVYDAKTASAMQALQKDQKELKETNGRAVGNATKKVLDKETAALRHAPERIRRTLTPEQRKLDESTLKSVRAAPMKAGDSGEAVTNVQKHLRAAGFDPKSAGGKFDERTAGALKAFQAKNKLPTTGEVDPATWRKLRGSFMDARGPTSPAQSTGERSKAVLQSEKLLKKLGYKPGKVDGLFDKNTQRASRRFERAHKGTGHDGKIDTKQLASMKKVVKSQEADKKTASFIDKWLRKEHSPAAGHGIGKLMVKYGKKYKIKPLVLLAIAGHETGYGKLGIGVRGMLGVGAFDADPNNATRNPHFSGADKQVMLGAETFANLRSRGGASSRSSIRDQVAAVNRGGWATDPNWHNGVMFFYDKIRHAFG